VNDPTSSQLLVAAFYKFVALPDFVALRAPLHECCVRNRIKGTILLATEGINGTITGSEEGVRGVLAFLRSDSRFADLEHKASSAITPPFERLKVRLKREIVTLGVPGVSPTKTVGQYVAAKDWNRLLDDPDVVIVDVRNEYEVALGTFKNALNPHTKSFRELPDWIRREPKLRDKPKVAMFCTGGIRCEKSTAFLKAEGFEEVYHLQGGILKYLETIPEEESRWEGECFVFDERVALGNELRLQESELCRSCCQPLSAADKASEHYVPGLACPHCFDSKSEEKQAALRERRRQLIR
jgi:UPF0176 protein